MKMQEELGEAAQALLCITDAPGCGHKGKTHEDFEEELCDMYLCLVSTLVKSNITTEQFNTTLRRKMGKWQKVTGMTEERTPDEPQAA